MVRGLAAVRRKPEEEIRGPSEQAAYDAQGKPTQALLGFLRSRGGTLREVKIARTEKGGYVYLAKPPSAVPAHTILGPLLSQVIARLRSPKTMRWDESGVRFARPIRWLLALHGSRPIPLTFGGLTSRPETRVGLPRARRIIQIPSAGAYLALMDRCGVMVDQGQRRTWIEGMLDEDARGHGGVVAPEMISYGLLDEVTHLVETPLVAQGTFDPRYLGLPREVLLASMAKHQRVFAVEKHGQLLPAFIAVEDLSQSQGLRGFDPAKTVSVLARYEQILNARLADSLRFWEDDTRVPLHTRDVRGVTFHERLGSMREKTARLLTMARALCELWRLTDAERGELERACTLAKADLVTAMVREFPTLQGVIGKHYARHDGEPEAVAAALEEQYLPAAGRSPKTLIGSALSLLDRYDTLSSYFAIGIEPSGDQDPFGLRRAAQAVVEVAWAVHRPLQFTLLLEAWNAGAKAIHRSVDSLDVLDQTLRRYLLDRLYTFAWPEPVPGTDTIDAVLAGPCADLVDVMDRVRSLQQLAGKPELLKAAKVIERTGNILRGVVLAEDGVDPGRFQLPLERQLWELYRSHQQELLRLTDDREYAKATILFGEVFFEPIHQFFNQVMVNVPEQEVRHNRLALMRAIHTLYTGRIADLSKLTVLQREERPG